MAAYINWIDVQLVLNDKFVPGKRIKSDGSSAVRVMGVGGGGVAGVRVVLDEKFVTVAL